MRITCLITICAYLSSTVSTVTIKHLNRIKQSRPREELIFKDVIAGKEINITPKIYPDTFPVLRKSRQKAQIEVPQNIKVSDREPVFEQYHNYNHANPRRLARRLKTRSIDGVPYELNDNHLNEFTKPIPELHEKKPIHIEPVWRVTTKKNVFDSIVDILRQLLNPPKNEPGPLVGPIQVPGSRRKIYLRLLEPVDASHVMVRFVTQVPVPVIDAEAKRAPIVKVPSIMDSSGVLLNANPEPIVPIDSALGFSNHHQSIHLPRNATFGQISGKDQSRLIKPLKNSSKNPEEAGKNNFPHNKEEATNGAKNNKGVFADTNVKLEIPKHPESQFLDSPSSYYPYQQGEDIMNQVKEILNDTTAIENDGAKEEGLEPWLTTHRLPFRQIISPLYPLTSMQHDSNSYENTYKVPSDVLTGPSSYSSLYEHYNNANSAPGSYANSYNQHYSAPSSYSTPYDQHNDIRNTLNTHANSYQKPHEFDNVPSVHPNFYQKPENSENAPSSHALPHGNPTDLYSASSSYSNSYEKQNDIQNTPSFNNALRVIDPPYFRDSQNTLNGYANGTSERIRQPRFNYRNPNEIDLGSGQSNVSDFDKVVWGKTKQERTASNPPQSSETSEINGSREKWQPIIFVHEDAGWHEAFADLTKHSGDHRETKHTHTRSPERTRKSSRNVSSSSRKTAVNQRRSNNRYGAVTTIRGPRCSNTGKKDECEPTTSPLPEYSGKVVRMVEQQPPPLKSVESIPVTTSRPLISTTFDTSASGDITDGPTVSRTVSSTMSSTLEKALPLIETTKSSTVVSSTTTTRKPVALIQTSEAPPVGTAEKLVLSEATDRLTINKAVEKVASSATKAPIETTTMKVDSTTKKLTSLKRPMIMKNPAFIMKKLELNSATKKITTTSTTTQKPKSTKKSETTRKSTFRIAVTSAKSSTI